MITEPQLRAGVGTQLTAYHRQNGLPNPSDEEIERYFLTAKNIVKNSLCDDKNVMPTQAEVRDIVDAMSREWNVPFSELHRHD